MRILAGLVLTLLLVGCSASYNLRRAKLHILKAEAKGAEWKSDTTYVDRSYYIPQFSHDTIYVRDVRIDTATAGAFGASFDQSFDWGVDTLKLLTDQIKTLVKINQDKVYIKTTCIPDTIVVKEQRIINRSIEAPPCEQVIKWWWLIVAIAVGAIGMKLSK